ncbi:hypothetical protein B6U90_00250 [Thermoplasmatales archaeon ex4484_6]|nr:MAG: hypothetical protein B6U90_00250 [Thermoplasmatales archaeon ex4484_6]RLF67563.1 MAG: hypothetical protein DRN57_05535 [Thermoplasmata archaeon]
MTIKDTHLRPQQRNPTADARDGDRTGFVKNVVRSTIFLKNGRVPGFGEHTAARSFSSQKAKAVRLSDFSFPVFIIRKPRQRSSYGNSADGGLVETPSVGDEVE